MKRFVWFGLAVGLLLAVAACGGPTGDLRGATPVGFLRPVADPLTEVTAESVTIADLLESPEQYEGQMLEVSGTFRQRQVVVCSSRPQYSPARWALSDGEDRVPIGSVDENLENLPSGKFAMVVLGRWLRWQGPVGCGRQAQVTEVWYLDVVEILSPNPITIAAVGIGAGDTTIQSELPGQPPGSEGSYPGPGTEGEDSQITGTLTISETPPVQLPGSVGTPVLPPTPLPPISGSNPTATPTFQNVTTPTSAAYPPPGNVTPTVPSNLPTASPTTAGGNNGEPVMVDQKDLPPGSIETALLGQNERHRWPLVITSTAVITISVASEFDLDAVITIEDAAGNVIAQQNNAQDGEPEILTDIFLAETGSYNILISGENDTTGYYAILVMDVLDISYYTFVFNGTLRIGDSRSANAQANNDHFWHFLGTAGESVNIIVEPSDDSDLFIRIYGPDALLLVDFHDDTGSGEAEELLSFTLPDTGFYSILVGELSFSASAYTISLMNG